MNKEQRKKIEAAVKDLMNAKAVLEKVDWQLVTSAIADAKTTFEGLRDEIQEKFDELGEKAQEGEKGTELSETIEKMEEVVGSCEELEGELEKTEGWPGNLDELITAAEESAG